MLTDWIDRNDKIKNIYSFLLLFIYLFIYLFILLYFLLCFSRWGIVCKWNHVTTIFTTTRLFFSKHSSEHFAIRFRQSYLIWEVRDVTAIELSSNE